MDEHMSGTESPDGQPDAQPGALPRPAEEKPVREKPMKVVVYSHDARTRNAIRLAIGRRPAPDVAPAEIIECATEPALFRLLDAGAIDVMVLDGEAQPAGGMGVCRQAKDEIYNCPPVLLVIGRPDDGWLATWSRADSVVSHPIDPPALAAALGGLMRQRAALAGA
jgi:DNA-binding response OmpR family regulator